MEEQTSWKGHSFTLIVFVGIVVLCSIFFILGMLVGREQGQKIASLAAADAVANSDAKVALREDKPELTFFESVEKEKQPAGLEPPAPPPAEPDPEPPKQSDAAAAPKVINYQIAALRKSADADKLLSEVKKKGFRSFILGPASGQGDPLFRVQVGPFSNVVEAENARKKLEAAGYQPILKK